MFQGQGKQESKLSLHSLLLKEETMNVSADCWAIPFNSCIPPMDEQRGKFSL